MIKMTRASIIVASLMLCAASGAGAATKMYKWVDDNGETHYGEVIPPEYANKNKVQLDATGHEVRQKETAARQNPEDAAAVEQRRKDKALLNTYSNEKEIDLARDRNLQQVEARIGSIKLLQQSAQETLDGYHKEAAGLQKAGKKIPASLQSDISMSENRVAELKRDLAAAEEKEAVVKAGFEADKARYRELTGAAAKSGK